MKQSRLLLLSIGPGVYKLTKTTTKGPAEWLGEVKFSKATGSFIWRIRRARVKELLGSGIRMTSSVKRLFFPMWRFFYL